VESLAKSWVNAQKLIGKEKLPIPTGADDKEGWQTVFTRLGRPEKAEGYEISKNDVPTEVPVEESFLTGFKTVAHTLGLLPAQTQGIFNWWVENEKGVITQLNETDQTDRQKAETELRQDMGQAYEGNIKLASSVISKFGGKHVQELLGSSFANNPKVIRLLSSIGKVMSEESLLEGEVISTHTPTEAQTEIDRIMGDPKHPYFHAEHPEHKAAVEYMQNMHKLVYPEGKK